MKKNSNSRKLAFGIAIGTAVGEALQNNAIGIGVVFSLAAIKKGESK